MNVGHAVDKYRADQRETRQRPSLERERMVRYLAGMARSWLTVRRGSREGREGAATGSNETRKHACYRNPAPTLMHPLHCDYEI